MNKEISTADLLRILDRPDVRIIDVRPPEAYNGWQLEHEPRGGHIKNAKSLPGKWTDYMDWIEMVQHKRIFPEHQIIVYGYRKEEARKVADYFARSGYPDVGIYMTDSFGSG